MLAGFEQSCERTFFVPFFPLPSSFLASLRHAETFVLWERQESDTITSTPVTSCKEIQCKILGQFMKVRLAWTELAKIRNSMLS